MTSSAAITEALALPRASTIADGLSSIEGARAAIARGGPLALKALEPRSGPRETLDDLAGGAQFGPWPPALAFLARADGEAPGAVRLVTLAPRAKDAPASSAARVARVEITSGRFDWFKPKARRVATAKVEEPRATKHWAELELGVELESGARTLVVGFALAPTEDAAIARLEPLRAAVAQWAGHAEPSHDSSPEEASARPGSGRSIEEAGSLAWSREGDVVVLRDFASAGPTRYTAAYRTTSIVSLVVALVLAGSLAVQAAAGAPVGALIGTGAVAVVLLINAFAFFQIAGFSGRYASDSLPLAWFADDRVVIGPWLSRYGAVDTRPSGRLGAAIPTAEVNGVACFERDGVHAVEMASEHGPLEIVRTPSRGVAEDVKRMVDALLEDVAAPKKKPKKAAG